MHGGKRKRGCVYLVTNKVNGKQYVGKTVLSLKDRKSAHLSYVKRKGPKVLFHRAIIKYGTHAFHWQVLVYHADEAELCEIEKRMIRKYKTKRPYGYNLTDGGEGASGLSPSLKTRKAISKAVSKTLMGHAVSAETRKKMSLAKKGKARKPFSAETRAAISRARKGIVFSEETRRRISQSLKGFGKGRKLTEDHKAKIRASNSGDKHWRRKRQLRQSQQVQGFVFTF